MSVLSIRVDFPSGDFLGPGKVGLLELIGEGHSIAAAARAMTMSYRRAWLMVDELNHMFEEPLVLARPGGAAGGQAALTPLGEAVISLYRSVERDAQSAVGDRLAALDRLVPQRSDSSEPPKPDHSRKRAPKRGIGGARRG